MGTIQDPRYGGLGMVFSGGGATILTGQTSSESIQAKLTQRRTAVMLLGYTDTKYANFRISFDLRKESNYTTRQKDIVRLFEELGEIIAKPDTTNFFIQSELTLYEIILKLKAIHDGNDVFTITSLATAETVIINESGQHRIELWRQY